MFHERMDTLFCAQLAPANLAMPFAACAFVSRVGGVRSHRAGGLCGSLSGIDDCEESEKKKEECVGVLFLLLRSLLLLIYYYYHDYYCPIYPTSTLHHLL